MLQPIFDTMLLPSLENMLKLSLAKLPEGLFRIHVTPCVSHLDIIIRLELNCECLK